MGSRRKRGSASWRVAPLMCLAGALFLIYQVYTYLNIAVDSGQLPVEHGELRSATTVVSHLLPESGVQGRPRGKGAGEGGLGRRQARQKHARGEKTGARPESVLDTEGGVLLTEKVGARKVVRARERDESAREAVQVDTALLDTIGEAEGETFELENGSATELGDEGEGDDEGEGTDVDAAVGGKPIVKRIASGDFKRVVELQLTEIMRGLKLNLTSERLVLNQQQMTLPEKSLRRAHVGTEDDLKALIPEEDLTTRYPRCAVVGNSGILLHQHAGLLIDKYSAVLRYNNAPTQGFEQYVGSRTTFRAINNKWTRSFTQALAKGGKAKALKLIPPDSKRTTSLLCFGKGVLKTFVTLRRSMSKDRRVYYIAPEITGYAKAAFKAMRLAENVEYLQGRMEGMGFGPYGGGHTMPSGFEGLFFMLQICDELHVYGFDPQTDKDVKYHYFDGIEPWENVHSFGFSFDFLRVLHLGGHIRLCAPRYVKDTGCPQMEAQVNEFAALWGQD